MPQVDEGLLHAWLDGQLGPEEAERVAELVASSEEWAAAAAAARGVIAASSRILGALDYQPAGVIPEVASGSASAPAKSIPRFRRGPVRFALSMAATFAVMIAGTIWLIQDWRATGRSYATSGQEALPDSSLVTPETADRTQLVGQSTISPIPAETAPKAVSEPSSPPERAIVAAKEPARAPAPAVAAGYQEKKSEAQAEIAIVPSISLDAPLTVTAAVVPPSSLAKRSSAPAAGATASLRPGSEVPSVAGYAADRFVAGSSAKAAQDTTPIVVVMERQSHCGGLTVTEYRLPQAGSHRVTMVAGIVGDSVARWDQAMACLVSEQGTTRFAPSAPRRSAERGRRETSPKARKPLAFPADSVQDSLRWIDPRTNRAYLMRGNVDQSTLLRIKESLDLIAP